MSSAQGDRRILAMGLCMAGLMCWTTVMAEAGLPSVSQAREIAPPPGDNGDIGPEPNVPLVAKPRSVVTPPAPLKPVVPPVSRVPVRQLAAPTVSKPLPAPRVVSLPAKAKVVSAPTRALKSAAKVRVASTAQPLVSRETKAKVRVKKSNARETS